MRTPGAFGEHTEDRKVSLPEAEREAVPRRSDRLYHFTPRSSISLNYSRRCSSAKARKFPLRSRDESKQQLIAEPLYRPSVIRIGRFAFAKSLISRRELSARKWPPIIARAYARLAVFTYDRRGMRANRPRKYHTVNGASDSLAEVFAREKIYLALP